MGKSATIMFAAKITGNTLVRFNMSSRVTIDDMLGKVTLVQTDRGEDFQFVRQPFTVAFQDGLWLLLDELNLAQDTVLQCIEAALDNNVLVIHDSSSATDHSKIISKHPNFRLFATQNPNSGMFKGKREKLSASFLGRFRPLAFQELPEQEWIDVISKKLCPHFDVHTAEALAAKMVSSFHVKVQARLYNKQIRFPELEAYAEISIRELLKWVEHLCWYKKGEDKWPRTSEDRILSFEAWGIYGSRFRGSGRSQIEDQIKVCGWPPPEISVRQWHVNKSPEKRQAQLVLDDIALSIKIPMMTVVDKWTKTLQTPFDPMLWPKVEKAHISTLELFIDDKFIKTHGLYYISESWVWEFLVEAERKKLLEEGDPIKLAQLGAALYSARVRHTKSKSMIVEIFANAFGVQSKTIDLHQVKTSIEPEWPKVLTPRILRVCKQIAWALRTEHPVLISGAEGCGKSECVLMLGVFQGVLVRQVCLTLETEPSLLVGQLMPNDKPQGSKIEWQDGEVTQAFRNGDWVLLDNLNQAEASVLERMNPVMEQEPNWVLTENGETNPLKMAPGFRIFSTMTPPDRSFGPSGTELSPALYNRFSVIHMENISFDDEDSCRAEINLIARAALPDTMQTDVPLTLQLCWHIVQEMKARRNGFGAQTFRDICRLINSTYLIGIKYPNLSFASCLWSAFTVCIASQIKDNKTKQAISESVKELLTKAHPKELAVPDFLGPVEEAEHILTPSREAHARAVMACVACSMPVLLEGPAAVGKTSLISFLCKHLQKTGQNIKLERVNNTDTTTIQDYLGSYLPAGGAFVFKKGALFRAMECGSWFLADEFNLADPVVMSMLSPLLEGKGRIQVPGSDKVVVAAPTFRFFATQNDAKYASRHSLPVSLRNRFLEVQVDEFPKDELTNIIFKRKEANRKKPRLDTSACQSIAKAYYELMNTPHSRISMREVIKLLHRQALFNEPTWTTTGLSLLGARLNPSSSAYTELAGILGVSQKLSSLSVEQKGDSVVFREGALSVTLPRVNLKESSLWKGGKPPPDTFLRSLIRLAFAVHAQEPVLLVGPTSYKSLLVDTWTEITRSSFSKADTNSL